MDIEALVTKYERLIPAGAYTLAEGIRAALTEADAAMAMEHNLKMLQVEANHAIELRAYEATVANQAERIRQLEAERAPDVAEVLALLDDICSLDPTASTLAVAQYGAGHLAQRIRHKLAAAPQQKKEGE